MSEVRTTQQVGTIDLIRALDERMAKVEQHLNLPAANMPGAEWHPAAPAGTVKPGEWKPEPPKGH